jgi:dsRNA-specific ribonuclease
MAISIQNFNESFQRCFGRSPAYGMPTKVGFDHCPTVSVVLEVDWGTFTGKGSNQKVARLDAATQAAEHPDCPLHL